MVRDASSGNGRRHHEERDHGPSDQAHADASKLTQELAQLLAASLAQSQLGKAGQRGLPSGSELANLASLVSAATASRAPASGFGEGLSALSYGAPPPRHHGQVELVPAADMHGDDEPMPIPSTWRQPGVNHEDRWFRQQLGAAILGLVAGLMIVVPTVLWLSGWLGAGHRPKSIAASQTAALDTGDVAPAEIRTMRVQVRPVEAAADVAPALVATAASRSAEVEPIPAEPMKALSVKAPEPARPPSEEIVSQAEHRMESGDVNGARELLLASEGAAQGPVTFALAETYDPNMLAAWGTRGVSADVAKARALYKKAFDLGIARAQARLDALK